jgi:Secretion system C-terminal sorting domain
MRKEIPFLFLFLPFTVVAQGGEKAAACFWGNDFEGGIPLDWTITQVERQTPTGVGLGEFVPAFTIGTAQDANAGGFFPVRDAPIGNQFIMANDDAEPCNCNMSDVSLTTGSVDLTGKTGLALEFRAFHEMTLGAGDAIIEASTNGTDWNLLDTLDAVSGAWQDIFVALNDYDNAPFFQLRFRWSDGGSWSSGFAVDDICLRERVNTDVSVIDVQLHDISSDPFDGGADDMKYTRLPLEQARPLVASVVVMNRGLTTITNLGAQLTVLLNGSAQGTFGSAAVIEIAPGQQDTLLVETNWTASSTGEIQADATLTLSGIDDDGSDNTGSATMQITGPGWDDGYSALARDEGIVQGDMGTMANFILANRLEIVNSGSYARGISVVPGVASQAGEIVRAYLMDANLALVDTSFRDTLSQDEIDLGYGGGAIYYPLSATPELYPGDYFVGFQHLSATGQVSVATSGNCTIGSSVLLEGISFDLTWTTATPMVRLHLADFGVGMPTTGTTPTIRLYPQPAGDHVTIEFGHDRGARLRILDTNGEVVLELAPSTMGRWSFGTSHLACGIYLVQAISERSTVTQRLVVVR